MQIQPKQSKITPFENLKRQIEAQAISDAKKAADIYFETFSKNFKLNLKAKISEYLNSLQENIDKMIKI